MKNDKKSELELLQFAESHRANLPLGFDNELKLLELDLVRGTEIQTRGTRRRSKVARIRDAVVAELHLLICTDSPKYAEVRSKGAVLSKTAAASVAGFVAATLGVAVAVASAAVGFIMLLLLRVGANTFCRLTNDIDFESHCDTARKNSKPTTGKNPSKGAKK